MDVSDGLVQDLGHLCRAGGLGAEIEAGRVPLSPAARAVVAGSGRDMLRRCLTGGDDYELLLAVPDAGEPALRAAARAEGVAVTRIGRFVAGAPRVAVLGGDGAGWDIGEGGWSHFA
jgi:thiamine-monophosphate kinase